MLFSLTNPEIAIMMMGLFLFAVLLGFPIAFTLMAMGLGFGYYAYFDPTKMEHLFDNRNLFQNLMKDGVIIRPIDLYEMPEFIRVTIGTSEENRFFIEALKKYI